jgi:hypothetical protein
MEVILEEKVSRVLENVERVEVRPVVVEWSDKKVG